MNSLIKSTIAVLSLSISGLAFAQNGQSELSQCLVDNLNGKERKELAKWIYLSMGVHPTLEKYNVASEFDREKSDKYVGTLVTRLLTDNCSHLLKRAVDENPMAIEGAFESVGAVAMQELTTNKETLSALSEYAKYVNQNKISSILAGK